MLSVRIAPCVALALSLAGCGGGEPTEVELRAAVERGLQNSTAAVAQVVYGKFEVRSFKKLGCKTSSDSLGYICAFEVASSHQFLSGTRQTAFVKKDDGWAATRDMYIVLTGQ